MIEISPLVVCWSVVVKLSLGEHVEESLALLWDGPAEGAQASSNVSTKCPISFGKI